MTYDAVRTQLLARVPSLAPFEEHLDPAGQHCFVERVADAMGKAGLTFLLNEHSSDLIFTTALRYVAGTVDRYVTQLSFVRGYGPFAHRFRLDVHTAERFRLCYAAELLYGGREQGWYRRVDQNKGVRTYIWQQPVFPELCRNFEEAIVILEAWTGFFAGQPAEPRPLIQVA